jgi:hypothetical protein
VNAELELTNVNRDKALQNLNKAYERVTSDQYTLCSKFIDEIKQVMFGTHLTFKYVMVNALLAKATNPEVNALCLQKKSVLPGAYDARTLCHKVLVPFERDKLNGALGGSNEPFLNKPARFPELSTNNAVRKGKDFALLSLLCTFLPQIVTQQEAFDALCDAIYFALEISKEKEEIFGLEATKIPTYYEIQEVIDALLVESFGGETLALTVGALMNLLADSIEGKTCVEVHVVNQSGASSKEVSDIDVYLNDKILYAIEAKDKVFTQEDVTHAIRKAALAGCDRLMFVSGPRAYLEGASEEIIVSKALEMGVYLSFMNHKEFTKMILSLILPTTTERFFSYLRNIVYEARLKEETLRHLLKEAREHYLIKDDYNED